MTTRLRPGRWHDLLLGEDGKGISDEARFAVGTFTRLPVPAPTSLDSTVAGRGLLWAPLVGAGLGLISGLPLLFTHVDLLGRLISATIVVALAAWLTRGLHWDGLADLADGLGSGAPADSALAVMRRSDIGPFGVLTLVLVLLMQLLSLAQVPAGRPALASWVLAMALGRLGVVIACGRWSRAARSSGLGALVAGSVGTPGLAIGIGVTLAIAALATAFGPLPAMHALIWAPLASVLTAAAVGMLAARRLGGITGDVLGAVVELGTVAALLLFALR